MTRPTGLLPPLPCERCPLRTLASFRALEATELAFIQRHKRGQRWVAAGGTIIAESDRGEGDRGEGDRGEASVPVFTLLSGWAFRHKSLPDGRRQIISILLPGDILGLQAGLLGEALHGIEALTDVTLCVFDRPTIRKVYRAHPSLALDLTWLAAHGERLVDDALLSVGRRTAMESLAALLVTLYRRAEAVGLRRGKTVPFPLTQSHLADALGLSAVHTNRTLQRMRRSGVVTLRNGTLEIGDLQALRRISDYWGQPARMRPLF